MFSYAQIPLSLWLVFLFFNPCYAGMEDFKKLKVTELKKVLEAHNLPLHGRKDDLVERVAELSKSENKSLAQLLQIDNQENKQQTPKAAVSVVQNEPTIEDTANKEQKWYVDFLERKQRLAKFGGEQTEFDKKIERMMRFDQLTKEDPITKIKQQGNTHVEHSNRRGKRHLNNAHRHYKSRPY